MSTATETAARLDVLTAAVCAMAVALPPEGARAAMDGLRAALSAYGPTHHSADAAAAGTLAQVLSALARSGCRTEWRPRGGRPSPVPGSLLAQAAFWRALAMRPVLWRAVPGWMLTPGEAMAH